MMEKGIMRTEFAVELNDKYGFVEQIDIFDSYEEAEIFASSYREPLASGEYLNIIFIDYDEFDNEIGMGIY